MTTNSIPAAHVSSQRFSAMPIQAFYPDCLTPIPLHSPLDHPKPTPPLAHTESRSDTHTLRSSSMSMSFCCPVAGLAMLNFIFVADICQLSTFWI